MENTTFNTVQKNDQSSLHSQNQVDASKIEFELTTDNMEVLLEKNEDFYNSVNSFDFNIFQFARTVGRNM